MIHEDLVQLLRDSNNCDKTKPAETMFRKDIKSKRLACGIAIMAGCVFFSVCIIITYYYQEKQKRVVETLMNDSYISSTSNDSNSPDDSLMDSQEVVANSSTQQHLFNGYQEEGSVGSYQANSDYYDKVQNDFYEEDHYEDEYEEYIFPNSDSEYLSKQDIKGMTLEEINLAKNELYARHGRMFLREDLQEYFDNCAWYVPQYTPEEWEEYGDLYFFNECEIYNRNLLKKRENKLK